MFRLDPVSHRFIVEIESNRPVKVSGRTGGRFFFFLSVVAITASKRGFLSKGVRETSLEVLILVPIRVAELLSGLLAG